MQSPEIIIQTVLISAIIGGCLVLCIAYMLFYYNKKQITLQNTYNKEVIKAQLEIQESTFAHISQELHDNIAPLIVLCRLRLASSLTVSYKQNESNINDADKLLEQCLEEIRSFARNLNSNYINENGLWNCIDLFVQQIENISKLSVTLNYEGEEKNLHPKTEIMLFRIIQESINNVLKHSCANKVILFFNFKQNELELKIEDNGIGFDVTAALSSSYKNGSSGLQNIITRVKMINGQYHINSKINKGTLLCITIPY